MAFVLKELPYAKNALAPHISEETMEFHHGKHLLAYVNNTNNLIAGTEFENMPLEDIIRKSQGGLFNNSAQIWNHEFFWDCMSPNGGGTPSGNVLTALEASFGSFDSFKEQFSKAATTLFGSGWAWLVKESDGKLALATYSNAGNPLVDGKTALLGLDVWEHAYYIDYRNARPKYIEHFFELINWDNVAKKL
ncbi:MAG: superoxide dismutase [Fe] [Ignavibacteriae bacterium HGW-Ignavibacteriae-1]|jgi:Fe-Mn family superoxide dismutase|nr:MAG: superoxide dismutase [Fe] [Ignavibacteriae bacterium HGW-Ignavibacteriae-1]